MRLLYKASIVPTAATPIYARLTNDAVASCLKCGQGLSDERSNDDMASWVVAPCVSVTLCKASKRSRAG